MLHNTHDGLLLAQPLGCHELTLAQFAYQIVVLCKCDFVSRYLAQKARILYVYTKNFRPFGHAPFVVFLETQRNNLQICPSYYVLYFFVLRFWNIKGWDILFSNVESLLSCAFDGKFFNTLPLQSASNTACALPHSLALG